MHYNDTVIMPSFPLVSSGQVIMRVSGCEDRVVILDEVNDRQVVLLRPHFYSQADCFYRYILQHPNRDIPRKEIEQHFERYFSMRLPAIVSSLNFRGVLRRLFFRVSQSHVHFFNPVTWERMQQMGISMEDIAMCFPSDNQPQQNITPLHTQIRARNGIMVD